MAAARRVLFVDDSFVARITTSKRLEGRGVLVTTLASRGEAAFVDPTSFAAALLDLDLGDGYGPDVAARLRKVSPQLPIAFLTGGGCDPNVVDAARGIGPIFSKIGGVDEAVGWAIAAVGLSPSSAP